jgi:hypothetical protein
MNEIIKKILVTVTALVIISVATILVFNLNSSPTSIRTSSDGLMYKYDSYNQKDVINEVSIIFHDSISEQERQSIIQSIDGNLRESYESINTYVIRIPATSTEERDTVIEKLWANPAIEHASKRIFQTPL